MNYLRLIAESFYSPDAYRKVYGSWKAIGILYLLLVVALGWILSVISIQAEFSKWVDGEAAFFANQVPKIRLQNGTASTDVETPYFIKDEKGEITAIIDFTGEIKSLDDTDAKILLTRESVSVRKSDRETRTFLLAGVKDQEIDKVRILNWLETARRWIAPVFYPFAVVFAFMYRLGQVLLYSLITLMLIPRERRTYVQVFRLTAVAVTPVILLNAVVGFLHVRIPGWWFACFVIAIGYIFFGVKSLPGTPPRTDVPAPVA